MLGGRALRQIGIPQIALHERDIAVGREPNLNVGELSAAEDEAKEMFAGLNKTLIGGLAVGMGIWYFFLRK